MNIAAEEARLVQELEDVRTTYRANLEDDVLKLQYTCAQRLLRDFRAQVRGSSCIVHPGSVSTEVGSLYVPKE